MNNCTLIKNSELEALRNPKPSIDEQVRLKTAELQNALVEKEIEIERLRHQISDMALNPRIDPMEMKIVIYREEYQIRDSYNIYNYEHDYNRRKTITSFPVLIESINFTISGEISRSISRIKELILNQARKVSKQEIEERAMELVYMQNKDFENGPKNDLIKTIMKMNWFQRRKYFKKYKKLLK